MLIGNNFLFIFPPKLIDFNHFTYLNTMAVSIFDLQCILNLAWFNEKNCCDLPITINYLINNQIGKRYNYIKKKYFWHFREYCTCEMWVVLIVLKLLFDLVANKIVSTRGITKILKASTNSKNNIKKLMNLAINFNTIK
jgi:hypothetical protein